MAEEEKSSSKQSEEATASTSKTEEGEVIGKRLGRCKWFNVLKGWGFIVPEDGGQEVFVHQSVIRMGGFRSLGENELVEFEYKRSEKGLEATSVSGPSESELKGSTFKPKRKKRFRKVRCYNCGEFANHLANECALGALPKRCHHLKLKQKIVLKLFPKIARNQINQGKFFLNFLFTFIQEFLQAAREYATKVSYYGDTENERKHLQDKELRRLIF
ncbi:hypothetical protein PVAND_008614 [Polypedilum vanderplanki]|uniref:CSD domain-containing protein n=1 Tax=Polypedilum vanderplanki TaxID=319348 RepID=A0A9J6CAS3_POLVA|nr:hypothetical protein PVAND_008614 [Polypedilum vanderplanki]